jgi:hypothetical protein
MSPVHLSTVLAFADRESDVDAVGVRYRVRTCGMTLERSLP